MPKNNLNPQQYIESLQAANLSIEQIIAKICQMKWEQDVLQKFLKPYSTGKILNISKQLQNQSHENTIALHDFEPENEPN